MDVISGKSYEVYEKKHYGEMQVWLYIAAEIKVKPEQDRHRHPAEIEESSCYVHPGDPVEAEKFIGGEDAAVGGRYPEQ